MTESKAARAAAKGAEFTFLGIISLVADLLPVKRNDGEVKTKLVSPDLDIPTPLKQQYVVEGRSDLGPYTVSTAARALETSDGELKFVTPEELAELRAATLPDGECDLQVYPAEQVLETTIPSGIAYRLRPAKLTKGTKSQQSYAMLVDLVSDMARRDIPLLFVGEITVKGVQRMVRVEARDHNLVIVELIRPGEMYTPIDVPLEYEAKNLELASELVELQADDFDPAEFASQTRARAEAFRKLLDSGEERPQPAPAEVSDLPDDGTDLMAALAASVAAAKKAKKKPAAKRAPRKAASAA